MGMGGEAPASVNSVRNVGLTFRLETKAQDTETPLLHTSPHIEVPVPNSDLLHKNPTFQNTQPHME